MVRGWTVTDTAGLLRVPGAHDDKRSRGVVALRTGSARYPGAAVLGVEATWRAGCGFVRYAGEVPDAVLARRPETVIGVDDDSHVDTWVIGSGTDPQDRDATELAALRRILHGSSPVVVDAGALDLIDGAHAPLILTPHDGEFARLWQRLRLGTLDTPTLVDSTTRVQQAQRLADATGTIVLRKGAHTIVAAPATEPVVVGNAPGWLAVAGAGDVLAGIIAALTAAHIHTQPVHAEPDDSDFAALTATTAAAAWLHGYAAARAAGTDRGGVGHPVLALEVAEALPAAITHVLTA